ncbi:hypothetical protein [Listeria grayi]|uniref:Uncharacterized protein n=2 Tax=Listeria grayi TaxID=1641 RepID=D7V050_LISGR|nr:hypothetical protein [Listeria grayi]EFI83803.1 hypothetical protein HMPREF0556_12488 [Listeria grayi DSM 20601]STY43098.1 Uncharacterised protein [Listeria grayi]
MKKWLVGFILLFSLLSISTSQTLHASAATTHLTYEYVDYAELTAAEKVKISPKNR